MATVYECENEACPLGNARTPGRFTDGITAAQATALTGDPEAAHGEGVCPNCGTQGKPTDEDHVSVVGDDPHQAAHDKIAARVNDPSDGLTADGAQDALYDEIGDGDDA